MYNKLSLKSKKNRNKKLICFVGIDGSGKTTQAINLVNELNNNNIKSIYMRPRYELIDYLPITFRKIVKNKINIRQIVVSDDISHSKRYSASKYKIFFLLSLLFYSILSYQIVIRTSLKYANVICDRYFYDWFFSLEDSKMKHIIRLLPKPNIIIFLDIPFSVAFSRMTSILDKNLPFLYYRKLRRWLYYLSYNNNCFIIAANNDVENIKSKIFNIVKSNL